MATASVDNVKDGLQTVLDWANSQGWTSCTGNVTSADISDMATKSWANSQGWTSCTGTVVASDLTPLSTAITTLEGKPGLDCVGTVVASDIANFITMADVNACGYTTCHGTVVASDIANFITMSDVDACGFSKATFSLSGNVLTITTA